MKFIESDGQLLHKLELTRRNLLTLLDKLDDPNSSRTIIDGPYRIVVVAVEDDVHYSNRVPGMVYMPTTGQSY